MTPQDPAADTGAPGTEAAERGAREVWRDAYKASREDGATESHAMARGDLARIEFDKHAAAIEAEATATERQRAEPHVISLANRIVELTAALAASQPSAAAGPIDARIELLRDWLDWALTDPRPDRQHGVRRARAVIASTAGAVHTAIDVERLREAARRAGLPREVTVADIENVAREYTDAQPSAAAAQGPGITDERAIRRDALNDVLANIAAWPVASDKIDHGAYGRGQVIGYLEGLILEADRVLDQPSIAKAEAALAARPDHVGAHHPDEATGGTLLLGGCPACARLAASPDPDPAGAPERLTKTPGMEPHLFWASLNDPDECRHCGDLIRDHIPVPTAPVADERKDRGL